MNNSLDEILTLAPIWYVAFLFSTVCHEAAHALVARIGGDDTAYAGGQVSLDPIPHIKREPLGLVVVPLISLLTSPFMIGWGSAPFNPYWQIRYPRRAALMALAGPVTNFLIALVAAIIIRVGLEWGGFQVGGSNPYQLVTHAENSLIDGLGSFLSILFLLNIILGVLNLLPVPPLDGYSVLGLFLPEDTALKLIEFARTPGFSIFGILLAWQVFPPIANFILPKTISFLFLGYGFTT
jgi:Zn-dependent protease